MGAEGSLWGLVRRRIAPYGYVGRVENAVEAGWPDVCYCLRVPARPPAAGWLELKHLAGWPAREGTPVNVRTLTLDQVRWAEGWTAAGGRTHLLLQAGRDYVLLDAEATRALFERELTRAHVLMRCAVSGLGRFPARELVAHLTHVV